ncbi:unnamed protein product [Closterium sp. Yama58-4]|nr:unnamed protein product [Closterium sp. Yama58-4]
MATISVLTFDAEGHPIRLHTWLDDLQLYLQSESRDGVSLFEQTSGSLPAPACLTRLQWLTRDATARLAIHNHLSLDERAHFGHLKTVKVLYDVVVARYSSPFTAALGRLMLPDLFPELSDFRTVADLVTHLRSSDTRFRAALSPTFLAANPPPMYFTLYSLVARLPDSLHAIRDHFLALDPTELTVDLLEKQLLTAETSAVAIAASRGTPRTPFFEGCSPSLLAPSVASAATVDLLHAEGVVEVVVAAVVVVMAVAVVEVAAAAVVVVMAVAVVEVVAAVVVVAVVVAVVAAVAVEAAVAVVEARGVDSGSSSAGLRRSRPSSFVRVTVTCVCLQILV